MPKASAISTNGAFAISITVAMMRVITLIQNAHGRAVCSAGATPRTGR